MLWSHDRENSGSIGANRLVKAAGRGARFAVFVLVFLLVSVQWGAAAEAPAAKAENPLVKSAADKGVKICLPRIEQVSSHLFKGANVSYQLMTAPQADQSLSTAVMEVQSPLGVSYASMTSAPEADGDCSGVYETVTYWKNSCADVTKTVYADLKPAGPVQNHIQVLEGKMTMRMYLLPAGEQGCVVIKKEVLY